MSNKITKEEFIQKYLKEGVGFCTRTRDRLLSFGIKENKCECCGLSEWQGKPLVIQVHHINGNRNDNRLENLQMLCPNCHSQTENFQSKNTHVYHGKEQTCLNCGKQFKSKYGDHKFCSNKCCIEYSVKNRRERMSPYSKEYLQELCEKYNTLDEIGFIIHKTRGTVRRYLIQHGLFNDFIAKRDFHNKPVLQYDLQGNFIKEWPSITDAQQTLNIGHIGLVCNGTRLSSGGFIWRYKKSETIPYSINPATTKRDERIKEVLQYSKEGNLMNIYSSIYEAARSTGINHTSIQQCLSGKNVHAKNYIWKYKDGEAPLSIIPPIFHNKVPIPVLQCDAKGNTLKEYPSIYAAAKSTGLNWKHISNSIAGRSRHLDNFIWKYKQ